MEPKAWLERENEFGKFAVAFEKCDVVVDIYQKQKTIWFAKAIL